MKLSKKILLSGIGLVLTLGLQLALADNSHESHERERTNYSNESHEHDRDGESNEVHISVCHKTHSTTNPYEIIMVDNNSKVIQNLISHGDSLLGSDASCSACGDTCTDGKTCQNNQCAGGNVGPG